MDKLKRYTIHITCSNCDYVGTIEVPKGTLATDLRECPNCGCKTATKKNKVKPPSKSGRNPFRELPYYPPLPQWYLDDSPLPPVDPSPKKPNLPIKAKIDHSYIPHRDNRFCNNNDTLFSDLFWLT